MPELSRGLVDPARTRPGSGFRERPNPCFYSPKRDHAYYARRMDTTISTTTDPANATTPPDVIVRGNATGFLQEVVTGAHHLQADEPVDVGGGDAAPGPYDYLLTALGVCTSMTIGLYARRKKLPLENITVSLRHSRIHAKDCLECETKAGLLDRIDVAIQLTGPLTPEEHVKLMEIAGKCPVHRTLKSEIDIKLRSTPA